MSAWLRGQAFSLYWRLGGSNPRHCLLPRLGCGRATWFWGGAERVWAPCGETWPRAHLHLPWPGPWSRGAVPEQVTLLVPVWEALGPPCPAPGTDALHFWKTC